MSNKHNKKRNIGIIYELLLRHIANCIIEDDKKSLANATKIIENRFNKKTELYKEFRLFNALVKSNISESHIAAAIMHEAKLAARRCNQTKLNNEKSALIKDINYKLNDDMFYHRRIKNYKNYATIQNLLNEWRKKDNSNLKKLIEMEQKIVAHLLLEKVDMTISDHATDLANTDSNQLVFKIMAEKINDKYTTALTKEQKDIIKYYAFYSKNNKEKLINFLNEKKDESLSKLDKFKKIENNTVLLEKIDAVKVKIKQLDPDLINDASIVKFLTLTKLINEINNQEE